MIALLLAPVLQFHYPVGEKLVYDMTVEIDGHLPLLGWRAGKAKLELSFEVEGLQNALASQSKAKHRILSFRSELNGTALPFKLENVKSFFPETTVAYLRSGHVIHSDAPKKELPSNIPGLDSQRFPEMTYLPFEWPERESPSWTFSRMMGGDSMAYEVNLDPKSERTWKFSVGQEVSYFEDGSNKRIIDEKQAKFEIATSVSGSGAVEMHANKSIVAKMKFNAKTRRLEKPIGETRAFSNREWNTKVEVTLRAK